MQTEFAMVHQIRSNLKVERSKTLPLIFWVSVFLQIQNGIASPFHPPKTTKPSEHFREAGKFKFIGDAGDISLEPQEFVELRLRYILNQSPSDIQELRELQQEEFGRNMYYKLYWDNAMTEYASIGKKEAIERTFQNSSSVIKAPEEYQQAISAYSYSSYYDFNARTRELCSALDIRDNYTYKSLFNLLHLAMETMGPEVSRILNVTANSTLYRGLSIRYDLRIGQEFTFQHFTSTTKDVQIIDGFTYDYGSVLEIQVDENNPIDPRHQISLRVHSFFDYEDEVLLSPLQSFVVHNITTHYIAHRDVSVPKVILKPKRNEDRTG